MQDARTFDTHTAGPGLAIAGIAIALIATTRLALAEPPPAAAPAADEASGVLVPEADATARWIWIPRALLLPLRLAARIGFAPLRGAAWLADRYRLRDRILYLFTSDDGRFAVYPTALFATGLGLNVGAHALVTDLAGRGERLSLSAGYGGELDQRYRASLRSGSRLGATEASARISFHEWNRYNYFGIGNAPGAAQTRFAQQVWTAELAARRPLAGPIAVQLIAAYAARRLDPPAVAALERHRAAIAPGARIGLVAGAHHVHGELGVALDTTAHASHYISRANPSTGWLATGFLGATQGLAGDPSHHLRYGLDARRYLDLYRGDRVLVLRAALEAVTAALDAIPAIDLPRIGGEALLRGFADDRFRDRVAAVATAEYRFPVQDGVTAFGFVDAGQVADRLPRLALRGWHTGVGGWLQFETRTSFLFRLQVATSDEGTFFQLAFDPGRDVHAAQRRW